MGAGAAVKFMTVVGAALAGLILGYTISHGTTTNCSPAPDQQTVIEGQFLALLNQYRAQNGAGPLVISADLSRSARWMSNDLATHAYFSHTDSLGRDFPTRMGQCGEIGALGENIAGGGSTAAQVLTEWQSSPGHNSNMLDPGWNQIGIGFSLGGVYGVTWVTDFGYGPIVLPTPTRVSVVPSHIAEIAKDGSW
jgi:uncharacterized protein YkwD